MINMIARTSSSMTTACTDARTQSRLLRHRRRKLGSQRRSLLKQARDRARGGDYQTAKRKRPKLRLRMASPRKSTAPMRRSRTQRTPRTLIPMTVTSGNVLRLHWRSSTISPKVSEAVETPTRERSEMRL